MKKRSLNNVVSRRRMQLKARHQQNINRQKKFFILFKNPLKKEELQ